MRTLLIDNYDSFTYNLFQLLAEVNVVEPVVVRNDEAGWDELAAQGFDAVVLSPGPGRPDRPADFGVCAEAIARCEVPLLGVCLGHQGIGIAGGAEVVAAPEPMHGRLSAVEHGGDPLFAGIPSGFEAVRYHSLCLARPLPAGLEEIAWTGNGPNGEGAGVPMAVARRDRPQWGLQFHPESVATEHGRRLLENFRDLAAPEAPARPARGALVPDSGKKAPDDAGGGPDLVLRTRRLDFASDAERAFVALYGGSDPAFWLDSSSDAGRFSFMGDASGPLGSVLRHDVEAGGEPLFDRLARELSRLCLPVADLPFDFQCGFAGYLGYELKAECGGQRAHDSPLPDAALVFAGRMLAFDHREGHVHLLCLCERGGEDAATAWLDATERDLVRLRAESPARSRDGGRGEGPRFSPSPLAPLFEPVRPRERYLDQIAECKRLLHAGETYEVCLTNSVRTEIGSDPLDLYRELRRVNPAPFASYLRFGDLAVLSSSPERFLRVDRERGVEAKPIKGTSRRGATPAEDERLARQLQDDPKSRAENLMIADLLRNDLGRVCEVGSVEVPALIEVESYATVHQLVSTVRGRLRPELGALDAIQDCFPPGSMTGAPKRRTMEILDRLEGEARGVYSGAIGYLGLGGGCDLSVTIRTIVLDRGIATIGTGGAIVVQSDPGEEYDEMLLKAAAPLRAVGPGAAAPA